MNLSCQMEAGLTQKDKKMLVQMRSQKAIKVDQEQVATAFVTLPLYELFDDKDY